MTEIEEANSPRTLVQISDIKSSKMASVLTVKYNRITEFRSD